MLLLKQERCVFATIRTRQILEIGVFFNFDRVMRVILCGWRMRVASVCMCRACVQAVGGDVKAGIVSGGKEERHVHGVGAQIVGAGQRGPARGLTARTTYSLFCAAQEAQVGNGSYNYCVYVTVVRTHNYVCSCLCM